MQPSQLALIEQLLHLAAAECVQSPTATWGAQHLKATLVRELLRAGCAVLEPPVARALLTSTSSGAPAASGAAGVNNASTRAIPTPGAALAEARNPGRRARSGRTRAPSNGAIR